jgi:hypothetical protein
MKKAYKPPIIEKDVEATTAVVVGGGIFTPPNDLRSAAICQDPFYANDSTVATVFSYPYEHMNRYVCYDGCILAFSSLLLLFLPKLGRLGSLIGPTHPFHILGNIDLDSATDTVLAPPHLHCHCDNGHLHGYIP